jgi:hypothetical protein
MTTTLRSTRKKPTPAAHGSSRLPAIHAAIKPPARAPTTVQVTLASM